MISRERVSIVIPTLNAAAWLPELFRLLAGQQPQAPDEIVLIDSGSTDATLALARAQSHVRVLEIEDFTHGGARNLGIREATGAIVVLMTQDAQPADPYWLQALVQPLEDSNVAGVYSRQVPREDASAMERFFLAHYFPVGPREVRQHPGSGEPMYPETFFSNVSSAARRDTWLRFPFDETLLMSEDQQFARDVLSAGLALVYEPASVVRHSHCYGLRQTFKRYFDSVVAFRQLARGHHAGISAGLGVRLGVAELKYLVRHHPFVLPYYALYQVSKAGGALAAHAADKLPAMVCARCSMQPRWWLQHRPN